MKKHLIILLVISVFTTASAQNYTQAFDSVFRHVQVRINASVKSQTAADEKGKEYGEEIVNCVREKCNFASKTSEQKSRL